MQKEIITRKEALERGLKRYFTGKPCKHGHVGERLVSYNRCAVCVSECQNKYNKANKERISENQRKYNKANKERIAEYQRKQQRKYYKANKEKVSEYKRKWYEENEEKAIESSRKYYKANKEKIAERVRKHYEENRDKLIEKARKYREENKEKIAESHRKYYEKNPLQFFTRHSLERIEKAKGKQRINRAELELGYTQQEFKDHIESQFKDGMSWDRRSEWHVDHVRPLSLFIKEGITDLSVINALENLQPLWAYENLSKGASYEE